MPPASIVGMLQSKHPSHTYLTAKESLPYAMWEGDGPGIDVDNWSCVSLGLGD